MWIIRKNEVNWTFVKIRSKTNPHLFISTKNEKGKWIDEDISAIEGNITGIYFKSYTSSETKKEIEMVNIKIQDWDDLFILQSAWTFALRNIVNCILGCWEKLGRVRIGVYGKQNGDKIFPAIAFKNNWEKTNWLLDIEQQKEMTTAITNTKTGEIQSYDYSDLNEFFKKKLIELNNRLTGGQAEEEDLDTFLAEAEEPKKVNVAETIKSRTSEIVDDLPF